MTICARTGIALTALAALVAGCPLPPPLQEGDINVDAAPNAPPVIVALDSAFPAPGPITVDRGDTRSMVLTVRDNDLSDIVRVTFFVDYGLSGVPTPGLRTCISGQGTRDREVLCALSTLCVNVSDNEEHLLEAMVHDADILTVPPPGAEEFRALPPGAERSFQAWVMSCRSAL